MKHFDTAELIPGASPGVPVAPEEHFGTAVDDAAIRALLCHGRQPDRIVQEMPEP